MRTYRRHYRRELQSAINVVPLLDVLLVLILIFIATAPIITQNVEVDLPEVISASKAFSNGNIPVIIEVSGPGQYTLVVNQQRMELIPPKQLLEAAKSRLLSNPKTVFLIGGAKEIPYSSIIKALNILHQAGVTAVGLMTQTI